MMLFKKFHNDLKQEFTDYNKSKCVSDLLAGLTVTAVAIPLALAFGVGSGATAASGLITAIVAGCFYRYGSGGHNFDFCRSSALGKTDLFYPHAGHYRLYVRYSYHHRPGADR